MTDFLFLNNIETSLSFPINKIFQVIQDYHSAAAKRLVMEQNIRGWTVEMDRSASGL